MENGTSRPRIARRAIGAGVLALLMGAGCIAAATAATPAWTSSGTTAAQPAQPHRASMHDRAVAGSTLPAPAAAVGNAAASWLIGQQFADGSFPWSSGDASAAPNTQGATSLGLLRIFAKNHDPAVLAAARANGDCQLANCVAGMTWGDGHHRFASHDPLFLTELSSLSGEPAYAAFVESEFWGRLQAGTYGSAANQDLAGYIANLFAARASIPELAAWDLSKLAIAASESGHAAETAQLMAAIRQSLEAAGPGHATYDEVALAGAIWASARTGINLDPTAGEWAAAASTADLATMLAGLQRHGGAIEGAFSDTTLDPPGPGSDGPNTQSTSYAMLALEAVDPVAYAAVIQDGFAFIQSQQLPSGQILYRPGASVTEPGGVESHGESLEAYASGAFHPDRYVGTAGADSGDCSDPVARCLTLAYALGQAAAYDTIHVAAGTYVQDAPLTIATEGVQIAGDDPSSKPVITRTAVFGGSANQPLLVVAAVKNVAIRDLDFQVDQSFAAEGIQAHGLVDGLVVDGNHFGASQSAGAPASFGRRNAISINLVNRQDGSFVRVENNVIDGQNVATPGSILFRAGVAMDAGVGVIRGNTIAAQSHDVIVRFATVNANSSADGVLIQDNQLEFGGLTFAAPNANPGALVIDHNTICAPAYAGLFPDEADFALARIVDNQPGVPLAITGNTFCGHTSHFRGLLIENFPGVTLAGNTFTPAGGATDFVSLVVSNKEITTDNPPAAPYPLTLAATGNVFNGSGVGAAGTAVELLDDNDANGAAAFGSLLFGGATPAEQNSFDGNLRWYFHLDDYTCDHAGTTTCGFLGYPAVGAIPDTLVRPFRGNVSAAQNQFAGAPPSAATLAALQAHTYDHGANTALGTVDYGLTATLPVAYVDDGFAGCGYGDALAFAHGDTGTLTVYCGIDAFATIGDGLTHVDAGGTVYVAKGSYADAATLAREVRLVGDGGSDANPADSTVLSATLTIAASGSSSASPLLVRNLRVTGVSGSGIVLAGSQSHVALDGVTSAGNAGDGMTVYTANAAQPSTTTDLVITRSHFDDNGNPAGLPLVAGLLFDEDASIDGLVVDQSSFDGNNAAGLTFNDIGAPGSTAQVRNVTITASSFSRNNPADALNGGGGLWLKTSAAGSLIDNVSVSGSTFADNGTGQTNNLTFLPPRRINANGISVRARPGTTLSNVHICANTFTDTGVPGTQEAGIYVFDDTLASNHGYQPVEVCASNSFGTLAHSVSGYEQFGNRHNQPLVAITGGTIANTEYINGFVTRVRDGATFATIGAAMADAGTTDGDEIHAPAGFYPENVTLSHAGMTLSGDGATTVIDGSSHAGSGITIPAGMTGVTLRDLAVQNFTAIGTSSGACIYGALANSHTTIERTTVSQCGGGRGGIFLSAGAGIDDVTIDGNDVSGIADAGGRGIVIWDGFKTHISITNNYVHDLAACCGIELQDGSASGVTVTGNTIERVGDSGMAFIQLTSGAGPNVIANNTLTDTGRFGMEIKLPNGTGADSGDGSIVVHDNVVTRTSAPARSEDIAGIAVIRRGYCGTCAETDVTTGVVVRNNTVTGWQQPSSNDGFGVVVEGTHSSVHDNTLGGNDVGVQLQAGNDGFPGDSNQALVNDFFSRGNAPDSCVDLGANSFSGNTIDSRSVSNPAGRSLAVVARNLTRGTRFCTIQGAIADSGTLAGDTIAVDPGTYGENLTLDKGVVLRGPKATFAGYDAGRDGSGEAILSPPAGNAVRVLADGAILDGFTIQDVNDTAIVSGVNYGGVSDNVQIINNRVLDVHAGSGLYTNGPVATPVTNWTVSRNLVSGIESPLGSGINLWAASGGVISDNHVENAAFGGIQAVGDATVQITGNTITGTGHNGINVAQSQDIAVLHNIVTDANTSATADEAGLTLYGGSTDVTFACNSVGGGGSNGFSTSSAITDPFGGIRVFDNAITLSAAVSHNLAQPIAIGSNWYGGGAATVAGSNAAGVQVADALTGDPTLSALCGDNTATALVALSGSGQSATVNTAFAQPLVTRITDALGGAVPGSGVAFQAPASGASAGLSATTVASDYNGRASVAATANAFAGSYDVVASTGSFGPALFHLTNTSAAGITLDLNGPIANVQQDVPTAYSGRIVNNGATPNENVRVHLAIASSRGGGIQAGDVTAEYDVGAGYQPLPLTLAGGQLVVDYGPAGGFALPAGYDVTTQFRFTFHHADSPDTTYSANAGVVGVDSATVYASDVLSTQVVPSTTRVSLGLTGPAQAPVDQATAYSARITNTGSPTPENVRVDFAIGRSGGIQGSDILVEYDAGGGNFLPLSLAPCGSQLCGSFGPAAGFAVPNGYDATTPLRVTYHRSGRYSVNAAVDGVNAPNTTYASASLAVDAGATASVDLDGPSQGVEVGGPAVYTVRLANPSSEALAQDATFAFEITDLPAGITAADVFSVEFDDGLGGGYQTIAAQGAAGPNGGLAYVFDHAGAGYAVGANDAFVGHVKVHFAAPTTYQLHLVASGIGVPAESYGADEVDTAVIAPTSGVRLAITGPLSGVEVGSDTDYIGRLQNLLGEALPESVHTHYCLTRDGNPVDNTDLALEYSFDGTAYFSAPVDAAGCVDFGSFTLDANYDQTSWFRANFAHDGSYQVMATLIGASGTVYAAASQSTLVTLPTGGRSLDLQGPLGGVGVGEDVAYLGTWNNAGSAIPGNQDYRLCVSRNGTPATAADVAIAYDLDGSGSYGNAATLDGAGCALIDSFHSGGGDTLAAELRYTWHHVGSYVSTAAVRSVDNPGTVYASGSATTLVGQGQALVTLSDMSANYDGQPHHATVTTVPGGLAVSVTYSGPATLTCDSADAACGPVLAGSYAVTATVVDADWSGSASGTYVIDDNAAISISLGGPDRATASEPDGAWTTGYVGTVGNSGGPTAQAVHYLMTVVRIDDNNADPISAGDVDACVQVGDGFQGACDAGYFSLEVGKTTGTRDGRAAVVFRYPNLPANDLPLPTLAALPVPFEFRFAPGEYRLLTEVVGSDGTLYASSSTIATTVPDAHIALNGTFGGSAEQSLLSTTTLRNDGGRLPENALVRLTLSSATALVPADAEFAYQVGGSYQTLPWTQSGNDLVTWFGPQPAGFPVADGYNQTTAGRGIFHRTGDFHLVVELVDAATHAVLYASDAHDFTIGAQSVAITLSDLNQVYDGTPRAVTVTRVPADAPVTVSYEGSGSTVYGPTAVPPTEAGTYAVTATADGPNYTGSASGLLTVLRANATVAIDPASLDVAFDGGPHAAVVTTVPGGLALAVTYDGSPTPPTAAGSYTVIATVTDPDYQGSATGVLTITAAAGSIVVDDNDGTVDGTIHRVYDGNAQAVTATTTPAGIAYAVTYTGIAPTEYPQSATPPSAVGQYAVVATTTDADYAPASANAILVIATDASTTIALDAATLGATYDGATHVVTATTTPAGLAYSVSYDGSPVPPVNAGSYAVVATITDPNYSGSASGTLVIARATGVVSFGPTNFSFDGQPHDTTAVISQEPGDTVACTISATSGDYPRTEAGSSTLEADCIGTNYAASAPTTLVVSPKVVSITLDGLGTFAYDGAPHAATATVNGEVAGFPANVLVTYNGDVAAPVAVGSYAVLASLDPLSTDYTASPTTGAITIVAGDASVIAANGATGFSGSAGQPLTGALPSVQVTDGGGNPVAGIAVTFAADAGSGTLSGALQVTDANGIATLGGWILDPTPGTNTVTASAAGIAGTVVFTADGAAAGSLGVTITDNRDYVQSGRVLTYTMTVGNASSSNANGVVVADVLPPELADGQWQCIAINGASCTAAGSGDLADTVDLPAGSSVVYLLTATVQAGQTDLVSNTLTATGANGAVSATDSTVVVLLRDGFDGGDGAQRLPAAAPMQPLGVLDGAATLAVPVQASSLPPFRVVTVAAAADGAFRIEAFRAEGVVRVRVVARGAAGERAGVWSVLAGGSVVLSLAHDGARTTLLLAGTSGSAPLELVRGGPFTLLGRGA